LCILVAAYEIESEPAISASTLVQLLTEAEPQKQEQVSNSLVRKQITGFLFCNEKEGIDTEGVKVL